MMRGQYVTQREFDQYTKDTDEDIRQLNHRVDGLVDKETFDTFKDQLAKEHKENRDDNTKWRNWLIVLTIGIGIWGGSQIVMDLIRALFG